MKDSLRKVRWSKSIRLMIKDLKLTVFTFVAILMCTFCVRETHAFSRFVRIVSNETKIRRFCIKFHRILIEPRQTSLVHNSGQGQTIDDVVPYDSERQEINYEAVCKTSLLFLQIIDNDINPYVDEWEQEGFFPAHTVFKKLGKAGFLGVTKSTGWCKHIKIFILCQCKCIGESISVSRYECILLCLIIS